MTNLALVYYSATGHGTAMAQVIEKAAANAGATVRVRPIAETVDPSVFANNPAWSANYQATKNLPSATADDLVWADAVIFGSPTRFSSPSGQFQTFIDTLGGVWSQGKLANKVYAAFTSAQTEHGGHELTLQKMYQMIMHWGGIIVAPGYTDPLKFNDGNPYGVSHATGPSNTNELSPAVTQALEHMAQRVVEVTNKLNS